VSDREHAEQFQCVLVEALLSFGEVPKQIEVKPTAGASTSPFRINDIIPDGHFARLWPFFEAEAAERVSG
jgi:hypothetical protein